jgi:hypothetical protein
MINWQEQANNSWCVCDSVSGDHRLDCPCATKRVDVGGGVIVPVAEPSVPEGYSSSYDPQCVYDVLWHTTAGDLALSVFDKQAPVVA